MCARGSVGSHSKKIAMNIFDLKTLKDKVGFCLRNYPETRDSDLALLHKIWDVFHGVRGSVELRHMYELPREDAVKRIRAMFNAEGRYYPRSWEVAKHRGIEEDVWRNALGYPAKVFTAQRTRAESYMDPLPLERQTKLAL